MGVARTTLPSCKVFFLDCSSGWQIFLSALGRFFLHQWQIHGTMAHEYQCQNPWSARQSFASRHILAHRLLMLCSKLNRAEDPLQESNWSHCFYQHLFHLFSELYSISRTDCGTLHTICSVIINNVVKRCVEVCCCPHFSSTKLKLQIFMFRICIGKRVRIFQTMN